MNQKIVRVELIDTVFEMWWVLVKHWENTVFEM
jgi:hypothetical protein